MQVAGPWTLAAAIELPSGHRVVSDHGATRDLIDSLVEGLAEHLAELRRRLPNARLVVQLDEPSVPAVLNARVPTPSGYGTARAIERRGGAPGPRAGARGDPRGRAGSCTAARADIPIELLREAGANAISFDAAAVGTRQDDALGTAVEAGVSLWAGVVPSSRQRRSRCARPAARSTSWPAISASPAERLAAAVVPTPTCGLAVATPAYARRVLEVLTELGHTLTDPD